MTIQTLQQPQPSAVPSCFGFSRVRAVVGCGPGRAAVCSPGGNPWPLKETRMVQSASKQARATQSRELAVSDRVVRLTVCCSPFTGGMDVVVQRHGRGVVPRWLVLWLNFRDCGADHPDVGIGSITQLHVNFELSQDDSVELSHPFHLAEPRYWGLLVKCPQTVVPNVG